MSDSDLHYYQKKIVNTEKITQRKGARVILIALSTIANMLPSK